MRNSISSKSKMRWIYELCKIYNALGLIKTENDDKNTSIKYQGVSNYTKRVNEVLKAE